MARVLQQTLKLIKELVEEFLGISLLACIRWLAIPLLEGEAKLSGVDESTLTQLKFGEEHLELLEHVVINHSFFILFHLGIRLV